MLVNGISCLPVVRHRWMQNSEGWDDRDEKWEIKWVIVRLAAACFKDHHRHVCAFVPSHVSTAAVCPAPISPSYRCPCMHTTVYTWHSYSFDPKVHYLRIRCSTYWLCHIWCMHHTPDVPGRQTEPRWDLGSDLWSKCDTFAAFLRHWCSLTPGNRTVVYPDVVMGSRSCCCVKNPFSQSGSYDDRFGRRAREHKMFCQRQQELSIIWIAMSWQLCGCLLVLIWQATFNQTWWNHTALTEHIFCSFWLLNTQT